MADPVGTWATLVMPRTLYDVFELRMESLAEAMGIYHPEFGGDELSKDKRLEAFEAAMSILDTDVPTLKKWLKSGERNV